MYADAHGNRQPFADATPPPSEHAHYQAMVNNAIAASQDGEHLQVLGAHLERIRTYDANILEAEHRSLQDMQYETGSYEDEPGGESAVHPVADSDVFLDDCLDYSDDSNAPQPPPPPSGGVPNVGHGPRGFPPLSDHDDDDAFIDDGDDDEVDPSTLVLNGDLGSEVSPVAIPPDDVASDTPAADVAPEHVPTPTVPVPTPTPSVINICDTPGCRRRPESDPCGLAQVEQHVCCDICLVSDGRMHTNACQAVNLTTALSFATAPAPPSGGNSGGDGRGSAYHDDDWRPGWHNYSSGASGNSDGFATGQSPNAGHNPTASLCDHDRSAPDTEESVIGLMLVQHDCKQVVRSDASSSSFLLTALPIALTVFVACYGLFSVSDFANPASRYGLPATVIGGVESDLVHYARFEEFYGCPGSDVLSFHDIRRLVLGLESGDIPIFKCGILELTATCFGRCPLRKKIQV